MSSKDALVTLGETAAEAVRGVLCSLCPDGVEKGHVTVAPSGVSPLESLSYPVVATDVSYTDGITGGNLFTITRLGARRLAAAMMFQEPPAEDTDRDLDEIETSALGEAMNQMMAASAAALAAALGYAVEISVPTTRIFTSADEAEGVYQQTPHATSVSFTLLGESCRLIQLIPNAFVVRMARALDSGTFEGAERISDDDDDDDDVDPRLASMLRGAPVRVTAELGRASVSLDQLADPWPGLVIELDRSSEEPIDLCVNGQRFAKGRLVRIDQTEWGVHIECLLHLNPADYLSQSGGI